MKLGTSSSSAPMWLCDLDQSGFPFGWGEEVGSLSPTIKCKSWGDELLWGCRACSFLHSIRVRWTPTVCLAQVCHQGFIDEQIRLGSLPPGDYILIGKRCFLNNHTNKCVLPTLVSVGGAHGATGAHNKEIYIPQERDQKGPTMEGAGLWRHRRCFFLSPAQLLGQPPYLCFSISSPLKMGLTSGPAHGVVRFQKDDMFQSTQHQANYILFHF